MNRLTAATACIAMILMAGDSASEDVLIVEINQSLGPGVDSLSGSWIFPDDPDGDLVFVKSVTLDVQHERAGDLSFQMPDLGLHFVNSQGGDTLIDGEYTFVQSGGAPNGSWADGPGIYDANFWELTSPIEYQGIEWNWEIQDLSPLNGGFVRDITIVYDAGIIPEPSSMILVTGLATLTAFSRRRRPKTD